MKELSIEEKAKAYDKALEKSKRLYEQGTITESLAYIFPELKESEDEKIRKSIIAIINNYVDNSNTFKPKMIAWLEKQGKTFTKKDVDDAYLKGVCDAKQEIEKQGEQKPTDKPKFKVKYAGSEYNVFKIKDIAGVTFYGIEDKPNHIDYVKADNCEIISGYGIKESGLSFPTKPVMFSEQKPAWSEEDELKRTTLIDVVKKQRGSAIFEGLLPEELTDWLESLKDRVQPKQEWSKEDETMATNIIIMLKEGASLHFNKNDIAKGVDWLKSLKPQNKWRPSDEQMEALDDFIYAKYPNTEKHGAAVKSLYQDLKKLTE